MVKVKVIGDGEVDDDKVDDNNKDERHTSREKDHGGDEIFGAELSILSSLDDVQRDVDVERKTILRLRRRTRMRRKITSLGTPNRDLVGGLERRVRWKRLQRLRRSKAEVTHRSYIVWERGCVSIWVVEEVVMWWRW